MTTKTKAPARAARLSPGKDAPVGSVLPSSPTLEDRLRRIEALGQRIDGYIRFMCQVGTLNGSSAEVKEKAVEAFYEQMIVVESQLGHIHDSLRLE